MKKNLKLLVSSVLVALAFSVHQVIHGMEEPDHELQRGTQQFKRSVEMIVNSRSDVWSEMKTSLDKTAEVGEAFQQGMYNLKIQFEELKTQFQENQEKLNIANQHIESLNEQLKTKQMEIDVLQIKVREAAIQELKTEQQRIKIQKIGTQEQIDRWAARIDETLEHIRTLRRPDLTCGKLLEVLVVLGDYYKDTHYCPWPHQERQSQPAYGYIVDMLWSLHHHAEFHEDGIHTCTRHRSPIPVNDSFHESIAARSYNLLYLVKKEVGQSIKYYKTLQGSTRPHWDELINK